MMDLNDITQATGFTVLGVHNPERDDGPAVLLGYIFGDKIESAPRDRYVIMPVDDARKVAIAIMDEADAAENGDRDVPFTKFIKPKRRK